MRAPLALGLLLLLASPASAQRVAPPLAPPPAIQGGSVPLSAIMDLAKPYPNLLSQIRLRLIATNVPKDKAICTAQRFPSSWTALGGARLGPYTCTIGKRTLTVTTEPVYYDKAGYKLKPDDAALQTKAAKVVESRLKWSWK